MEQKLGRLGSLSNSARKLNRVVLRNFKGAYVASTLRASDLQCTHTQSATSERVASKTRVDPIFYPWLIKYGGKSGFSLSNSVVYIQILHQVNGVCNTPSERCM